jgi:hypothetical protein
MADHKLLLGATLHYAVQTTSISYPFDREYGSEKWSYNDEDCYAPSICHGQSCTNRIEVLKEIIGQRLTLASV